MEKHCAAADQLSLITGHVRLLADLMLAGPDLQDVDRGAFAQVLQDLALRLERITGEMQNPGIGPRVEKEAQP
jgi:hypothetical protein